MSEQLFVEVYDQMDDAILEMVLTDTVEKMCIESEENMEAIGNYVELLETGKSTSKYDDAFTAMIAETFTNEMVNCVSLFEAFDPSYGGDDDEYRKKYPEAFKKPLWARTKEAAKSKFADLRDTLRTYKKISLEPRMKAWGEKLKTLQEIGRAHV